MRVVALPCGVVAIVCGCLVVSAGAAGSPPTFVQQATVHSSNVASVKLTPKSAITAGNRLIVLVGIWSGSSATASSVTDSAGNSYTELLHFQASDQTEMIVWSAPITSGGGARPTITVKPTSTAAVGSGGVRVLGLSTAPDASIVGQKATASGTTSVAATVASGPTPGTGADNELALGMYVDSGFGGTLTAGSGFTQRSNVSNTSNMELLSEVPPSAGATPNAAVHTGANTTWLMATWFSDPRLRDRRQLRRRRHGLTAHPR